MDIRAIDLHDDIMGKRQILILAALASVLLLVSCNDEEVPGVGGAPTPRAASAGATEIPGVVATATRPPDEIPGVEAAPTQVGTTSSSACTTQARCLLNKAIDTEADALEAEGDIKTEVELREAARQDIASALALLRSYEWRSSRASDLYARAREVEGLD
ncbi:hypothetical protein [Actinoplanes sp. HUAS TT8]|uniref:hypothetical protein n=1 Tax=Actinoplanes sp. HUAS TT8 TaxID=3447453 RepID=UPI003F523D7E